MNLTPLTAEDNDEILDEWFINYTLDITIPVSMEQFKRELFEFQPHEQWYLVQRYNDFLEEGEFFNNGESQW